MVSQYFDIDKISNSTPLWFDKKIKFYNNNKKIKFGQKCQMWLKYQLLDKHINTEIDKTF